jgi:uncharacterized protein YegL
MATCPSCGTERGSGAAPCRRCGAEAQADLAAALAFDEARPASGDSRPLHLEIVPRLEFAAVPRDSDPMVHLLLDLEPSGDPVLDPSSGAVAHVILALDLSASMNHPDKYPVLTEALGGMLYDLASPTSAPVLLSIVVFARGAEVLFRDVLASTVDPREVLAAVDNSPLRFGRYTDIVGALSRAGRIAHDQLRANKAMPTRIYLLTDGKPQDMAGARSIMERVRKLPVDVDGLAFGADADVDLLQQLVCGGRGGTVKQIRTDTLSEAFERIAEVAQRVVSTRALVEIELAPGVVGGAVYRYRPGRHAFGENAFAGGSKFATDLGTLESGRTYSMLLQVRLPETSAGSTEVGTVTVRLPAHGGPRTFSRAITVPRPANLVQPDANSEVAAAAEVVAALTGADPKTQLRALRIRRKLYAAERRDPHILAVIDKAIAALEQQGNLEALSAAERATLRSHTVTAGGLRQVAARTEHAAG